MTSPSIRCRLVACPERAGGWSFWLVNDAGAAIGSARVDRIEPEWGDRSYGRDVDGKPIGPIEPGRAAELWDDPAGDDAEFRQTIWVRVTSGDRDARIGFEFPKLYVQRRLEQLPALGRDGFPVEG